MSYRFADNKLSANLYDIYHIYRFADSKLSGKLYDIYHCCVYIKRLLVMETGTVRNM